MWLAKLQLNTEAEHQVTGQKILIPAGTEAYFLPVHEWPFQPGSITIWREQQYQLYKVTQANQFETIREAHPQRVRLKSETETRQNGSMFLLSQTENAWELEKGLLYFAGEDIVLHNLQSDEYQATGHFNIYVICDDELAIVQGEGEGETINYQTEPKARQAAEEYVNQKLALAVELREWLEPFKSKTLGIYLTDQWFSPTKSLTQAQEESQ